MADETFDSGSRDRATVALVYRAVDDLAKVQVAEFRAVHARLDGLSGLPTIVASLDDRVKALEDSAERRKSTSTYRSTVLPTILIGLMSLIIGGLGLYIAFVANSG